MPTAAAISSFETCRQGVCGLPARAAPGEQGNAAAENPSLSSDGRFVAFETTASNLVDDDTNATWDVFIKDMVM